MIEINIPEEAALNLLKDQISIEIKRQKRTGLVDIHATLDTLSERKLKEIVEISLFDILVLLPVTLITEESNLPKIISKVVRSLSVIYANPLLSDYSEKDAKSMLSRIKKSFGDFSKTTTFQNN